MRQVISRKPSPDVPSSRAEPPKQVTTNSASPSVGARFAHDFSRIPAHALDSSPQLQASANEEAPSQKGEPVKAVAESTDIGVALSEFGGSDTQVTVKVQIVSGSKPVPGQDAEPMILGGLKGGHVVINLGADGVLGFSNTAEGAHLFSRRKSKNSKFEHYSQEEWQQKIQGKQVVTFDVVLTAEQRKTVMRTFEGEPSVDYSVAGYRCASYALRALEEAGVIKGSQFSIKYLFAPTPNALVRFLERQGFTPEVQEGSKTRRWNRKFKAATSGEGDSD